MSTLTVQDFKYSEVVVTHKDTGVSKQYWDYFFHNKETNMPGKLSS